MSKPVIVVGIDFGTTYSGFSWATTTGTKEINLITEWKTTEFDYSPNHEKTRSWISYKDGTPASYGYEATGNPLKWFKLLLQPGQYSGDLQHVREANANLRRLGKPVDVIVADYLKWIWNTGKEHIRKAKGNDFESVYDFKVVLTVPAAWEPIAKDRTLKAAREAGLPGNIKLISEPEAAAISTLLHKRNDSDLKVGEIFVVCDAGGGTVDLISYEVASIRPLQLKECAVGEGDLCGSVFLDLGFEQLIKRQVGEAKYLATKERDRRDMISQFEYRIKRQFDGDLDKEMSVTLRGIGEVDAFDSDEEDDELIHFNGSELAGVFEEVCKKTDRLVANQVSQITSKGRKVKAILLVGGFGESNYLHGRLDKIYQAQNIAILKTFKSWSAVCRGATAWGLDESTLISFIMRHSYGQDVAVAFDSSIHDYKDRFWDPSEGIWRANNQMAWMIRKGDDLKVGTVLTLEIHGRIRESTLRNQGTYKFDFKLWYNGDLRPPGRREDNIVRPLCAVEFDLESAKILQHAPKLPNSGDNGVWYDPLFLMKLEVSSNSLVFSATFANEMVGVARHEYVESFDS